MPNSSYKIRLLILGLVLLIHNRVLAQQPLTVEMLVPDQAIKVSPLHLLNFYPTIELSYEKKILPKITLQAEAGYVLDFKPEYNEDFQDMRGVKLKLEGRCYFWGRTDRRKMYYVALEPYMNIINFDRPDSRTECFDLECNHTFVRNYRYKMEYREQGVSVKAGMIRYWGEKFFLDINSGFTIRNINYHKPMENPQWREDTSFVFFDIPNEEDRVATSLNLGVRIGYRLK